MQEKKNILTYEGLRKYEDELKQLSQFGAKSITAIIDSERTSEGAAIPAERQAFQDVCTKLGYDVYITERRATENYVPQEAINHVVAPVAADVRRRMKLD